MAPSSMAPSSPPRRQGAAGIASGGDVRLTVDLRRPNTHDELALDAVPLGELLRSVGAHVLRPEEGGDAAALGQVVDQAGLALDRRVRVRRLRILDEYDDRGMGPDVGRLNGLVPGREDDLVAVDGIPGRRRVRSPIGP